MNADRDCDVLIVGGGPGGSTLAGALRGSGLEVLIADKQVFPRDKVCAGWVTPSVLQMLGIDHADYAAQRTLQPIHRFHFGIIGGPGRTTTNSSAAISYGILRREFDQYLLERSQTPVLDGQPVNRIERRDDSWLINGRLRARMLVGAGGHFCPVAKHLRRNSARDRQWLVTAKEAEFTLDASQAELCPVTAEVPEIYFEPDLGGYGWLFRKGQHLNVGLGLLNANALPSRLRQFEQWLREAGRLPFAPPVAYRGHAYTVYHPQNFPVTDERLLLLGDAIGLAHPRSGEGIRPAIESALLAAATLRRCNGDYRRDNLQVYEQAIIQRFGDARADLGLPAWLKTWLVPKLFRSRWFVERQILEHWLAPPQALQPLPTA